MGSSTAANDDPAFPAGNRQPYRKGAHAEAAVERPVAFWYRIGVAAPRVIRAVIRAADEAAALARMLDRHPEAAGRLIVLDPYRPYTGLTVEGPRS